LERIYTVGGNRLAGDVTLSGSKNATLALLAAALCAEDGQTLLTNVPNISDVRLMSEMLGRLGVPCRFADTHSLIVDATNITSIEAPYDLIKKMRASFSVLGPILARCGQARVALPGGCDIGARPVDFHLKGLELMGASIVREHGFVEASAPNGLHGAAIYLDFPSVGATTHLMAAAALATGDTLITNAAQEPDVIACANFINAMGGRVYGAGTTTVKIEGTETLHGTSFSIDPDRIEAGTFAAAAAISQGDIFIRGAVEGHMMAVLQKLEEAGAHSEFQVGGVRVSASSRLKAVDVKASPHPGFPTDLQPIFAAAMTIAEGTSIVTETVYERRFKYVEEMARMGADIRTEGRTAVIAGVPKLTGAPVSGSDLRATAALVLAGLVADGQSEVTGVEYLDRGYEGFVDKLESLGGEIWRGAPVGGAPVIDASGGSSSSTSLSEVVESC